MNHKIYTSIITDGNMSSQLGNRQTVDDHHRRFFAKHGINHHKVVYMEQVHLPSSTLRSLHGRAPRPLLVISSCLRGDRRNHVVGNRYGLGLVRDTKAKIPMCNLVYTPEV